MQHDNGADFAKVPRHIVISPGLLRTNNLFRVHIRADVGRRGGLAPLILGPDEEVQPLYLHDYRWAITTRVDPTRDTLLADSTPIDYLDFASPVSGLGSKMGLDATHKWPGETSREWGRPLQMSTEVTAKVEQVWQTLGL